MVLLNQGMVAWAEASRPGFDRQPIGDGCLVRSTDRGVLIAVCDGLGNGVEAAAASRIVLSTIENSRLESPEALCRECHRALFASRGVVLGIADVDVKHGVLGWLAVGPVSGLLGRIEPDGAIRLAPLVARAGIVGRQLPALRVAECELGAGDILVLTTDGIRADFELVVPWREPVALMAREVLSRCSIPGNDALVVVARYTPPPRVRYP